MSIVRGWERRKAIMLATKELHFKLSGLVALIGTIVLLSSCDIMDNPPRTLQMAAFKGNKRAVNRFLSEGVSINAHGEGRETALHFAVYGNRKAMVEYLLLKGADIEAQNASGRTPLHGAAWKGFTDIAKVLLANGANIKATGNNGLTPLDLAVEQKHEEMIKLLRHHGAIGGAQEGKRP